MGHLVDGAVILAVVLIFVIISIDPARVLLAMALAYACSAPLYWIYSRYRKRSAVRS